MKPANLLRPLWLLCFVVFNITTSYALSLRSAPDSIQLIYDQQQLILPGESFRIGVIAYYRNEKVKQTMGLCGGSTLWWRYKVEVTGGSFFNGNVTVNSSLVPSKGKYIEITVSPRKEPGMRRSLLIPLNYETQLEFRPSAQFDRAPGCTVEGELLARFDNNQTRIYTNLRGRDATNLFSFETRGGEWQKGKFIIESDITRIEKHRSDLIVKALRNQQAADTFTVQLDYKHPYKLRVSGSSGFWGFSGSHGSNGSTGQHGGHGGPGGFGEMGDDGPDIGVWADLYYDSLLNCNLLYVYAENLWKGQEFRYLINPEGGSLLVGSYGGSGGNGGDGGHGGDGGQGYEGEKWVERHVEKKTIKEPVVKKKKRTEKRKRTNSEGKEEEYEVEVEYEVTEYVDKVIDVVVEVVKQGPGGPGGDGGCGGPGGLGAPGGYGGNIDLYFTADAKPYMGLIRALSVGGSGGKHGSGGYGGSGGRGGSGNPDGRSGASGCNGPSVLGWADSGGSGRITVSDTEEFFEYVPSE
jgi:hypothetical protein